MADTRLIFNQVNLVVHDMQASVDFYERLGVPIAPTDERWTRHHRNAARDDPVDLDLDSIVFARQWDEGWPDGETGVVLGFRVDSAEAVDAIYSELTGAGFVGQQAPYDAFFGARYAVVLDPDGNAVGLMGPRDRSRSTTPEPPD
jgi:catechol 2,3-dioxygenase-like lactoylglutathione lyase family enzyme